LETTSLYVRTLLPLSRITSCSYQGQDYLLKMASDLDLLKSDSVKRLLENLNITPADLQGVIFWNEMEIGSSHLSQFSVSLRESATDLPPFPATGGGLSERSLDGAGDGGQVEAHSSFIQPEIEELNTLIREETTLQRALTLENKALLTRGTFIPLLKYELNNPQESLESVKERAGGS
jgi:hypothetical protein